MWDCCGLEFLRSLPQLTDAASIVCDRPQLQSGRSLLSSSAPVTVCDKGVCTCVCVCVCVCVSKKTKKAKRKKKNSAHLCSAHLLFFALL